jgi:hypothetical protein
MSSNELKTSNEYKTLMSKFNEKFHQSSNEVIVENEHKTLMTDEITDEMLLKRKVLIILPDGDGNINNKQLLNIFQKSHILGITWNIETNKIMGIGYLVFSKTNE